MGENKSINSFIHVGYGYLILRTEIFASWPSRALSHWRKFLIPTWARYPYPTWKLMMDSYYLDFYSLINRGAYHKASTLFICQKPRRTKCTNITSIKQPHAIKLHTLIKSWRYRRCKLIHKRSTSIETNHWLVH